MSVWLSDQVVEEKKAANQRAAERYLQWLPRRQRLIVCLVMGFGGKEMSSDEIATKLHMTSGEVEKQYRESITTLMRQASEFAEFVKSLQVPSISIH